MTIGIAASHRLSSCFILYFSIQVTRPHAANIYKVHAISRHDLVTTQRGHNMRNQKDRRASQTAGLFTTEENTLGQSVQERRHIQDRRLENLTMEERQLQFSEMPSQKLDKSK